MRYLKMDRTWMDANAGLMAGLMMVGVGIFSIAVLFTLAPAVGSKIEVASTVTNDCVDSSTAAAPPAWNCSEWNVTEHPENVQGYSMWQSNAAMLSVAVLVVIAGVILSALSIYR